MKILPLHPKHFDLLEGRAEERVYIENDPQGIAALAQLSENSVGGCFVHDGRVLAIMGYIGIGGGAFQLWSWPSIYVPQYPIQYLRCARKMIELCEEMESPVRLETMSIDSEAENRWMQFLGFESPDFLPPYYEKVVALYGRVPLRYWQKECA